MSATPNRDAMAATATHARLVHAAEVEAGGDPARVLDLLPRALASIQELAIARLQAPEAWGHDAGRPSA